MNWMELVASLVSSLAWPAGIVWSTWLLRDKLAELLRRVRKAKIGPSGGEFELFEQLPEISANVESEGDELQSELDTVIQLEEASEEKAGERAGTEGGPLASDSASPDSGAGSEVSSEHPAGNGPATRAEISSRWLRPAVARKTQQQQRRLLDRLAEARPDDLLDAGRSIKSEDFARLAEISPTAAALHIYGQLEHSLRTIMSAIDGPKRRDARLEVAAHRLGLLSDDDQRAIAWLRSVRNELSHGRLEINTALAHDFARLAEQVEQNVLTRGMLQARRQLHAMIEEDDADT